MLIKIIQKISNAGIGFCVGGISGLIYISIFKNEVFMFPVAIILGLFGGFLYDGVSVVSGEEVSK